VVTSVTLSLTQLVLPGPNTVSEHDWVMMLVTRGGSVTTLSVSVVSVLVFARVAYSVFVGVGTHAIALVPRTACKGVKDEACEGAQGTSS
jgi:multidrug transporter EmrE-like cation transporter